MNFLDLHKNLVNGENMGGLPQKVYFGYHKDVAAWPGKPHAPANIEEAGALVGDLVMKIGKRLHEFYITDDTGEFKFEPVGETDGKSFILKLSIFHPGLSAKVLGFMNVSKNDNLVFVVPDNNGKIFLMGDELRPATFSASPDGVGTSKETAGRRGASVEFQYKTSNAYEYNGAIPIEAIVPFYGVQFDTTNPSPILTRIAGGVDDAMLMHASLPVQNKLKRCINNGVTGVVEYYQDENDSTLKTDGITPAILTGADGMAMVEIPEHWRRCTEDGVNVQVVVAEYPLPGSVHVPKMYISAYEASVDRSIAGLPKLASVVNMTPAFRGGNNNDEFDGQPNSLLGMPATQLTIDQFRQMASNRANGNASWNQNLYEAHVALYWLYVIEYANFQSQADFNPTLTAEGYKQGGLGKGATNFDGQWGYNNYNPFIPCGITNSLGNNSGEVAFTIPVEFTPTTPTIMVNSYRGVENVFGHLYKWADGIHSSQIMIGEDQMCGIYVCDDPSLFTDLSNSDYGIRGIVPYSDDFISKQLLGAHADIIGAEYMGSEETYICDYGMCEAPDPAYGLAYVVRVSGYAGVTSYAGFGFANAYVDPSSANAYCGSRLCFKAVGASAPRRPVGEPEV